MKRLLTILVPLLILVVGVAGAVALIAAKPKPVTKPPETVTPLVRVRPIALEDVRLKVSSQGTVSARTESLLVPEVAGRIIEVADEFASGGFFEQDEVLLRIDPGDYRRAVAQAEAAVANARLRLAREEAEAEIAVREWRELHGDEPAPPLTRREPQLEDARAALRAMRVNLEQARLDLERTYLRAPYACRVREKLVDVGTYVAPGTPMARIYSVDYAEIRLPVPDEDLAYLDLPLDYRDRDADAGRGPEVILSARFAGERHEWKGRVVRTEGEIDPKSRLVHVVARVRDPYGRGDDPSRPPLAVGMYVQAEILGRRVEQVAVVPRSALRGDDRLMVVDAEDRLRFRSVDIIRTTHDEAIIGGGLLDGDRVLVSPIATGTDGMRVRTTTDSDQGQTRTS